MGDEVAVEGEVQRVTYENAESGFRVLRVDVPGRSERLTVVGVFPPISPGARVRVHGTIETDARHGEQLRARNVTELAPNTLLGIERYLGSGLVRGLGPQTAKRIADHFGLETLRILDEEPSRLLEITGLGKKRVELLQRAWGEQRQLREVMVFLQGHGITGALAARVVKRYGERAVNIVSTDPYRLALDVWGVGFKTADGIAERVGIAKDAPARLEAGILQVLRDRTDAGHTVVLEDEVYERAADLLGLEAQDPRLQLAGTRLAHGGFVVPTRLHDGDRALQSSRLKAAEQEIADRIHALLSHPMPALARVAEALADFEQRTQVALAPEQKEAVGLAAAHGLVVVTGGPGVGKTTIIRAVIGVFERAGLTVRLAAPTGRAAKRLSEATQRPAQTLHRLLEFDPKTLTFKRNEESPLEAQALVVDEASMVDVYMAEALLRAVALGARLVLVGDVDQLPSVGPGAFLRDSIDSDVVPCARLRQIFRQAEQSFIVTNAHRVNAGEMPAANVNADDGGDFFVIERSDPQAAQAIILELVTTRIPKRFGLDPVRDIQVLVPMHRGPLGTTALNAALQAKLNPTGPGLARGDSVLRLGDKVMQLRNDYDKSVFNGDLGLIKAVSLTDETLVVRFDADEAREVEYSADELDALTLAYACTIHKSQGSEYPAVVVPFAMSHFVMLSRNLLYTAITRGKQLVTLVTDKRALSLALAETRRGARDTTLRARLSPALDADGTTSAAP
jgi:exodeoxyribonuclease V alpha subunit